MGTPARTAQLNPYSRWHAMWAENHTQVAQKIPKRVPSVEKMEEICHVKQHFKIPLLISVPQKRDANWCTEPIRRGLHLWSNLLNDLRGIKLYE